MTYKIITKEELEQNFEFSELKDGLFISCAQAEYVIDTSYCVPVSENVSDYCIFNIYKRKDDQDYDLLNFSYYTKSEMIDGFYEQYEEIEEYAVYAENFYEELNRIIKKLNHYEK